ncbi:RNA 3'-terminal-phosphate cyclase [Candidatus Pacearchaeota archaeon RBG_13_36_9]|nr:MAG: RNA 3'-terminal-phosphate cyclase [Candidatus Pacearchaeota archaeon RBG_13_36_9]
MIQIDGSFLEGGGQILRTSLSLSALTGKPFKIENIRKNRNNPGLAVQHLEAIRAIAAITNTKTDAKKGDITIEFSPKERIKKEEINIEIPTAGSASLIISTILPIAYKIKKDLKIRIHGGGTWNKWAPSVIYLQKVLLPLLKKAGFKGEIEIKRDGFVPRGGAILEIILHPWKNPPPLFLEQSNISGVFIESVSSVSLEKARVAERQIEAAESILKPLKLEIEKTAKYVEAYGFGSGILICSSPTILGRDIPGERGITAEKIGKQAAMDFLSEVQSKAAVDSYAADQLMIYLALAGGKIKTSFISDHAKTNAYTIEKFLPVKFSLDEKEKTIECKKI